MDKKNTIPIDLKDWEIKSFKDGSKHQITLPFTAPDFENIYQIGDILYCKESRLHLEVISRRGVNIHELTDQDAMNEGIAALYPHSGFGGEGFYLPDQIIEATPLECFKHYWNNKSGNEKHPFDINPTVVIFGLKIVKK